MVEKCIKVWIGSDHGGYDLKGKIWDKLVEDERYDVIDVGSHNERSVDYPDFGWVVAESVGGYIEGGEGEAFGILVCGTGIGMSMVANRRRGVRAAVVTDLYCAEMTRRHNDANVLCLGARVIDEENALDIVEKFLSEKFEGGRHERRVGKIHECEKKSMN